MSVSAGNAAAFRLVSVLDTAVDAILIIDDRGRLETFNRAAEKMFGYGWEEVIGKNVSMLMPEPYCSAHDSYLANYLRTGDAKIIGIGREVVGRRKNGAIFPMELAISEIADDERRAFTGVVRDISERRQLEFEILEVSEREQQRIGYDLHDGLCQELSGIAFAVQALGRSVSDDSPAELKEVVQITQNLQNAVRHAKELAQSLYPVDPQPNGLAVALQRLADDASDTFKVDCEFEGSHLVEVRAASVATHLYRIAQDAVRAAVRQGNADHIVISLIETGDSVFITVWDNGVGRSVSDRYRHDVGLRMMQHRAKAIGAKLQLQSGKNDQGVIVICELKIQG